MSPRKRDVDTIALVAHAAASPLVTPEDTDVVRLVAVPPLPDLARPPAELMPASFDPERALAVVNTLFAAIETAPDLATLRNLEAYGSAFQHLLRRLSDGRALANAAAAATLVAERRLGTELARLERNRGHQRSGAAIHRDTIRNLGVDRRVARFWEQVAAIPDETFESYVGPAREGALADVEPERMVSRRALLRLVPAPQSAPEDEAPADERLLTAAAQALGRLDHAPDPGSDPLTWRGRLWVAPGRGDEATWADACVQGFADDRVEAAVLHLGPRTDASYWALLASYPLCVLRGHNSGVVFGIGVAASDLADAFGELGWAYAPAAGAALSRSS